MDKKRSDICGNNRNKISMEFLIGIQCKDFVLLATDRTKGRSILRMKDDADKMFPLAEHKLLAISGEGNDDVRFAEYIQKNMKLHFLKNEFEYSTHAVANFARSELAKSLRTRNMYISNMLIAGWDSEDGPALYYLDYIGALVKIPFGCHGYGSVFSLSVLDRFYKVGKNILLSDLTLEEAVNLLSVILKDIKKRFIVSIPNLFVRAVGREGIVIVNPELTTQ